MNKLRRWIDGGGSFRSGLLVVATVTMFLWSLELLAYAALFLGWWVAIPVPVMLPLSVWLFLAIGTNWRWDGS